MLVEVSDSSVEFMNTTFSFYVNSKHWLCNDDVVYVYRAYTCTTVTAQAFKYACASRRTAGQSDVRLSQANEALRNSISKKKSIYFYILMARLLFHFNSVLKLVILLSTQETEWHS